MSGARALVFVLGVAVCLYGVVGVRGSPALTQPRYATSLVAGETCSLRLPVDASLPRPGKLAIHERELPPPNQYHDYRLTLRWQDVSGRESCYFVVLNTTSAFWNRSKIALPAGTTSYTLPVTFSRPYAVEARVFVVIDGQRSRPAHVLLEYSMSID